MEQIFLPDTLGAKSRGKVKIAERGLSKASKTSTKYKEAIIS